MSKNPIFSGKGLSRENLLQIARDEEPHAQKQLARKVGGKLPMAHRQPALDVAGEITGPLFTRIRSQIAKLAPDLATSCEQLEAVNAAMDAEIATPRFFPDEDRVAMFQRLQQRKALIAERIRRRFDQLGGKQAEDLPLDKPGDEETTQQSREKAPSGLPREKLLTEWLALVDEYETIIFQKAPEFGIRAREMYSHDKVVSDAKIIFLEHCPETVRTMLDVEPLLNRWKKQVYCAFIFAGHQDFKTFCRDLEIDVKDRWFQRVRGLLNAPGEWPQLHMLSRITLGGIEQTKTVSRELFFEGLLMAIKEVTRTSRQLLGKNPLNRTDLAPFRKLFETIAQLFPEQMDALHCGMVAEGIKTNRIRLISEDVFVPGIVKKLEAYFAKNEQQLVQQEPGAHEKEESEGISRDNLLEQWLAVLPAYNKIIDEKSPEFGVRVSDLTPLDTVLERSKALFLQHCPKTVRTMLDVEPLLNAWKQECRFAFVFNQNKAFKAFSTEEEMRVKDQWLQSLRCLLHAPDEQPLLNMHSRITLGGIEQSKKISRDSFVEGIFARLKQDLQLARQFMRKNRASRKEFAVFRKQFQSLVQKFPEQIDLLDCRVLREIMQLVGKELFAERGAAVLRGVVRKLDEYFEKNERRMVQGQEDVEEGNQTVGISRNKLLEEWLALLPAHRQFICGEAKKFNFDVGNLATEKKVEENQRKLFEDHCPESVRTMLDLEKLVNAWKVECHYSFKMDSSAFAAPCRDEEIRVKQEWLQQVRGLLHQEGELPDLHMEKRFTVAGTEQIKKISRDSFFKEVLEVLKKTKNTVQGMLGQKPMNRGDFAALREDLNAIRKTFREEIDLLDLRLFQHILQETIVLLRRRRQAWGGLGIPQKGLDEFFANQERFLLQNPQRVDEGVQTIGVPRERVLEEWKALFNGFVGQDAELQKSKMLQDYDALMTRLFVENLPENIENAGELFEGIIALSRESWQFAWQHAQKNMREARGKDAQFFKSLTTFFRRLPEHVNVPLPTVVTGDQLRKILANRLEFLEQAHNLYKISEKKPDPRFVKAMDEFIHVVWQLPIPVLISSHKELESTLEPLMRKAPGLMALAENNIDNKVFADGMQSRIQDLVSGSPELICKYFDLAVEPPPASAADTQVPAELEEYIAQGPRPMTQGEILEILCAANAKTSPTNMPSQAIAFRQAMELLARTHCGETITSFADVQEFMAAQIGMHMGTTIISRNAVEFKQRVRRNMDMGMQKIHCILTGRPWSGPGGSDFHCDFLPSLRDDTAQWNIPLEAVQGPVRRAWKENRATLLRPFAQKKEALVLAKHYVDMLQSDSLKALEDIAPQGITSRLQWLAFIKYMEKNPITLQVVFALRAKNTPQALFDAFAETHDKTVLAFCHKLLDRLIQEEKAKRDVAYPLACVPSASAGSAEMQPATTGDFWARTAERIIHRQLHQLPERIAQAKVMLVDEQELSDVSAALVHCGCIATKTFSAALRSACTDGVPTQVALQNAVMMAIENCERNMLNLPAALRTIFVESVLYGVMETFDNRAYTVSLAQDAPNQAQWAEMLRGQLGSALQAEQEVDALDEQVTGLAEAQREREEGIQMFQEVIAEEKPLREELSTKCPNILATLRGGEKLLQDAHDALERKVADAKAEEDEVNRKITNHYKKPNGGDITPLLELQARKQREREEAEINRDVTCDFGGCAEKIRTVRLELEQTGNWGDGTDELNVVPEEAAEVLKTIPAIEQTAQEGRTLLKRHREIGESKQEADRLRQELQNEGILLREKRARLRQLQERLPRLKPDTPPPAKNRTRTEQPAAPQGAASFSDRDLEKAAGVEGYGAIIRALREALTKAKIDQANLLESTDPDIVTRHRNHVADMIESIAPLKATSDDFPSEKP